MTATPSPRRDGRTTDTRRRAQAVALELFATRGFEATSLQDIARELGVTKAALYYHFPAKADLARSVFQPFIDDVDRTLAELSGRTLPRQDVLTAYVQALLPHRAVLAAMLRDPGAAADLDLEGASRRWLAALADLLAEPATTPSSRTRVRTAVAVGGLTRALVLPEVEDPDVLADAVAAAVRVLAP
ncbi:transcriptional regulator, TetR family [Beutenbergia cavernae DSM 12333]|uniref:Transcriptional regulator, TetR family n=1 Tax=Beutenbergia cavernae (strain ATCC BAA-8 / DSM 12333 / CCUG 43141 / JCM 11478 / NBRC 16432 / NCIMB 13614 / HKI 0122) TaxID=471853 RepID=C5BZR9_BEUC1|nr:helix-turn-helix domain-containing protein [Beutenbergia cavernae]ACQ81249.1 transcriptional regulator, TetR family [Beutenbergia cavernae DSM 12333]